MRLFLNGGGDGEKCLQAYKRLNQIINHKKPILYIPIAMEEEKYGDCEKWIKNELKDLDVPYIEMITSGIELANKNLADYSALFIGGGNTFKLLYELKSSGAFEKIKEFINNNGIVFGGSAGAIIFGYDLEACLCDDINEIELKDIKGFDVLNGFSLLCHYTNRNEEKIKSNTDYLLKLSYKRKSIAIPEEDTIFINEKDIEIIGDKDYYVFENGKCERNIDINLYLKIELLVAQKNLGTSINNITTVTGGLSHRMYKVETDKGIYAIKELNSGVMKREKAYSNFVFSEKVTDIAKENGISAIGAIKFNNDIMIKIEDSYFMVFEWLEGKVLKPEEIIDKHCEIIGKTLAQIHNIDFSKIDDEERKNIETQYFDWNKYIPFAEEQNKPYSKELKENVELLYELNKKSVEALEYAKDNLVISHTDLDRKNVMWQGDKAFIIDWEASGYINPTIEIIQVAWYWSGGDVERIDYNKFEKVINSYKQNYNGNIDKNIDILINADIYGGLAWIEYNLKRSLCIENNYDKEEILLAENEVLQSLKEIKYNVSQFEKMIKIIDDIIPNMKSKDLK